MPKIHLLDDALISKIAAGEVIERPASVVKELVENSLDAHATSISVSIEDGGRKKIIVTDDGEGMDEEDCKRCIGRHATSKMNTYQDLFAMRTLGFRGEALASIAAVADITITSRMRSSQVASVVHVSRGEIIKVEKIGAPFGTEIIVTSLFAHTPARKKYLKTQASETALIAEVMTRFALVDHTHHIQLFHNNQCILNASPVTEWIDRLSEIYGQTVTQGMVPVYSKTDQYLIKGFVSKPELTRPDKRYQQLYINNRWIKSKLITEAVYHAYGRLLFHDRYPVFVLLLELPPQKLDVNVHPTKREVRLLDEQALFDATVAAVTTTLQAYNLTPATTIHTPITPKQVTSFIPDASRQTPLPTTTPEEPLPFVIKGVIHDCFWIVEDQNGLMLVDHHAADERANYEQLTAQYAAGGFDTQQLLEPVPVTLPAQDMLVVSDKRDLLSQLGFILEPFGTDMMIIRSSPVILGRQQTKELLFDLISELSQVNVTRIEEIKDNIIARMACRMSVKKGDKVETHEMYKIMKRLLATKIPYTCPHGRPTMITLSSLELEKKFKRCG